MSTHRISPQAGWVSTKRLPKGPNGRALCRQCGEEVPKGRRTFCGDTCVNTWRLKTDPAFVRQMVHTRDKGVCALCGIDTHEWAKERRAEWAALQHRVTELPYYEASAAREAFRREHPHFFSRQSYWDADHIVPVVEGGGECDLDNYRTFCIPCHKQVTRELAARRAEARRPELEARRAQRTEEQRIERELASGKARLF